jgi:periplasmic divalent cation tolerance protein
MADGDVWFVFTTVPDAETGDRIAAALVGEGLAACVNRVPGLVSHYVWEGELRRDAEEALFMKTTAQAFPRLRERLAALHPYEIPACSAWPIAAGAEPFLAWVRERTRA